MDTGAGRAVCICTMWEGYTGFYVPTPPPSNASLPPLPLQKLKHVVEAEGERWEAISAHFPDRSDLQCQQRWQKVVNPELVKGPWTKEVGGGLPSLASGLMASVFRRTNLIFGSFVGRLQPALLGPNFLENLTPESFCFLSRLLL